MMGLKKASECCILVSFFFPYAQKMNTNVHSKTALEKDISSIRTEIHSLRQMLERLYKRLLILEQGRPETQPEWN